MRSLPSKRSISIPSRTKPCAKPSKNQLQPHRQKQWVIPPEDDAGFVYHMEDVLAVYHEPCDPDRPVVCFDEHPTQLVKQVREPTFPKPGSVVKEDYHSERNGSRNLFLACEPLGGWRTVEVSDRRTTEDWVNFIKDLVDEQYADVECIRLVLDNLNTHKPAAFYQFFPPDQAQAYLDRFEFHYTPKRGSWLNMAEIGFNVIQEQCLDRRIPDKETLRREVTAWTEQRNDAESDVKWQFTSEDARAKLHQLYPSIED